MIHNHKFNVIKLMNNVKINDFNTVIFQHYTPGEGWWGGGCPCTWEWIGNQSWKCVFRINWIKILIPTLCRFPMQAVITQKKTELCWICPKVVTIGKPWIQGMGGWKLCSVWPFQKMIHFLSHDAVKSFPFPWCS